MRIQRLVKCERMTPNTALRLSKVFGKTPAYGMNMQVNRDLVEVQETTDVSGIEPLIAA
jgi:plasmid maintenance system antidote protein VapI